MPHSQQATEPDPQPPGASTRTLGASDSMVPRPLLAALDLDRTLIYSPHSLRRFSTAAADTTLVLVESQDGQPLSYADARMLPRLAALTSHAHVVPTTARTPAQYDRLHLAAIIGAGPAICANGGKIVVDGEIDHSWQTIVEDGIRASGLHATDVAEWLATLGSSVLKVRVADDLFSYAVLDLEPDVAAQALDLRALRDKLADHRWRLAFSGRKLYALPEAIEKSRALAHLARRLGTTHLFAAGDSELDAGMLALATASAAPAHGDAAARAAASEVTAATGPAAAVEILDLARQLATRLDDERPAGVTGVVDRP